MANILTNGKQFTFKANTQPICNSSDTTAIVGLNYNVDVPTGTEIIQVVDNQGNDLFPQLSGNVIQNITLNPGECIKQLYISIEVTDSTIVQCPLKIGGVYEVPDSCGINKNACSYHTHSFDCLTCECISGCIPEEKFLINGGNQDSTTYVGDGENPILFTDSNLPGCKWIAFADGSVIKIDSPDIIDTDTIVRGVINPSNTNEVCFYLYDSIGMQYISPFDPTDPSTALLCIPTSAVSAVENDDNTTITINGEDFTVCNKCTNYNAEIIGDPYNPSTSDYPTDPNVGDSITFADNNDNIYVTYSWDGIAWIQEGYCCVEGVLSDDISSVEGNGLNQYVYNSDGNLTGIVSPVGTAYPIKDCCPLVNTTPLTFPISSEAVYTQNLNEYVIDSNGDQWFIDTDGQAVLVETSSDPVDVTYDTVNVTNVFPTSPSEGDSYINSNTQSLFIYDGTQWVLVPDCCENVSVSATSGVTPDTNPPSGNISEGDTFINSEDGLAWIYDDINGWVLFPDCCPVVNNTPLLVAIDPSQVQTSNFNSFVIDSNGDKYYIDKEGNAMLIEVNKPVVTNENVNSAYDPDNPPTAPVSVPSGDCTEGDLIIESYNCGSIIIWEANASCSWFIKSINSSYEKRLCINTIVSDPATIFADIMNPTHAEVQAWTVANVDLCEQLNGTHLVYFVDGQGGSCDDPDYIWVLNQGSALITDVHSRNYNSKILYVDPSGNNSTAKRGYPSYPYRDPWAARAASKSGDKIHVHAGVYTYGDIGSGADFESATPTLFKDELHYHLEDGVYITPMSTDLRIFKTDLDEQLYITGYGVIKGAGSFMAEINHDNAILDIEAKEVSSTHNFLGTQGMTWRKVSVNADFLKFRQWMLGEAFLNNTHPRTRFILKARECHTRGWNQIAVKNCDLTLDVDLQEAGGGGIDVGGYGNTFGNVNSNIVLKYGTWRSHLSSGELPTISGGSILDIFDTDELTTIHCHAENVETNDRVYDIRGGRNKGTFYLSVGIAERMFDAPTTNEQGMIVVDYRNNILTAAESTWNAYVSGVYKNPFPLRVPIMFNYLGTSGVNYRDNGLHLKDCYFITDSDEVGATSAFGVIHDNGFNIPLRMTNCWSNKPLGGNYTEVIEPLNVNSLIV